MLKSDNQRHACLHTVEWLDFASYFDDVTIAVAHEKIILSLLEMFDIHEVLNLISQYSRENGLNISA